MVRKNTADGKSPLLTALDEIKPPEEVSVAFLHAARGLRGRYQDERLGQLQKVAQDLVRFVRAGTIEEPAFTRLIVAMGEFAGLTTGDYPRWVEEAAREALEPTPKRTRKRGRPRKADAEANGKADLVPIARPWPRLATRDLPTAVPFPLDAYAEPIQRFAVVVSDAIGCPIDYPAVQCLGVGAGAISRSVALKLKDGYYARGSIYAATVGPVGDGKSPSLTAVTIPVIEIDRQLDAQYEAEMEVWKAAQKSKPKEEKGDLADPKPRPLRFNVQRVGAEPAEAGL
jgi:hypothetical protein